jgi:tripartite-type tricarboxylate transporter receptor subunit TctC
LRRLPRLGAAVLLIALAAWNGRATAEEYPARPITIYCGYGPGTGGDLVARYFADKLRPYAGQPVLVENKAGALTNVAAETVAHAKPDGYSIFITGGNATFASNPWLFKKLPFDPIKDFTPVTTLAKLPFLVVVRPQSPVTSLAELTAALKARGTKASYGYTNAFALPATEFYKKKAGVEPVAVAYKTTPPAVADLLGGELDFMFIDATYGLQQVRQGQLRALAVTTAKRSSVAPEFPGMREAGVDGYDLSAWWGAWLPANAPPAVVAKLETWLNEIVQTEVTRAYLLRIGAEPFPGSAKLLAEHLPREMDKWGRIIRDAKIEPE